MNFRVPALERRLSHYPVIAAFIFCHLLPVFRLAAAPSDDAPLKPLAELHTGTTQALAQQTFSPDGSLLATSRKWSSQPFSTTPTRGVDLIVWDAETGDAKAKVADGWLGFAFNGSGNVLAVWTDREVSILEPESGKRLATLVHHGVEYAKFLPQADLVVTQTRGSKGFKRVASELHFWSTKTWERVETKIDRYMPLICPAVSTDGKYVAGYKPAPRNVKNRKSQLKLWDLGTGQELPAPKRLPDSLRMASTSGFTPGIGFTNDGKALCVFPLLWDIEATELKPISISFDVYRDVSWPRGSLYAHPEVSFQPSKKRAKIIDGKILVWDAHEGKPIAEFINPVREEPVNTVPHLRDSIMGVPWVFDRALAFTTKDASAGSGTVDIWETSNGKKTRSIVLDELDFQLDGQGRRADLTSPLVRVAKDGKTIVVLEAATNIDQKKRSCRVTAYDFETGKRQYQLNGHNDFVSSLCLSPGGRLIATGSGADPQWDGKTGEVKLWDLKTGKLIRTVIHQGADVLCLAFDSRGEHLAIGREMNQSDPEVSLWEVSTGIKLLSLQLPPSNAVVRSPFGSPYENKHQNILGQPHSLAFSSDDRLLAVGGNDQLSLWNMPNGEFRSIGRSFGPVHRLQFSKDGEKLYFGTHHLYEVQVSKLRGRQALAEQVFRPMDAVSISGEFAMAASDRLIASCSAPFHINSGEVSLWDVENKELLDVICHDGVRSVDFTPDSQLVTGSIPPERFSTTILDPKTGGVLVRFRQSGHAAIQFSPGGEVFAALKTVPRSTKLIRHHRGYLQAERTSSVAGIYLWDTRTGRKLAELPHEASTRVLFSPDGKILASVGPVSTKLWQVSEFTRGAAD
jgi:WD40 repeat protein